MRAKKPGESIILYCPYYLPKINPMETKPAKSNIRSISKNDKSNFGNKEIVTIVIAIGLISVSMYLSIKEGFLIELFTAILLSFGLGLLSFLMIGQLAAKEITVFQIKISQASGGFLVFIILLSCFLGYKKISSDVIISNSLQIDDPRKEYIWKDARGTFEWFNPPLALAAKEHLGLKVNWFKEKDFQLHILLLKSQTSIEDNKRFYEPRIKNLKIFIDSLKGKMEKGRVLDNHVIVRVFEANFIPTQSFFTTNKYGPKAIPHSIFYLPSKENSFKPSSCIVSSSATFNVELHREFESYWASAKDISLEKLLSTGVVDTIPK